jgi:urease accessory protein UreH
MAWSIVSLGRPQSGEAFERGTYFESLDVFQDSELLLSERLSAKGSKEGAHEGAREAAKEGAEKGAEKGASEGSSDGVSARAREREDPSKAALSSPMGLASFPVFSVFLALGGKGSQRDLDSLHEAMKEARDLRASKGEDGFPEYSGETMKGGIFLARSLGSSTMAAKKRCLALWGIARRRLLGKEPVAPRVWRT